MRTASQVLLLLLVPLSSYGNDDVIYEDHPPDIPYRSYDLLQVPYLKIVSGDPDDVIRFMYVYADNIDPRLRNNKKSIEYYKEREELIRKTNRVIIDIRGTRSNKAYMLALRGISSSG